MTKVRRKGITIVDVASEAGVSHQTVSRVINHHPNVAPATRRTVERVIEKLGYRPNTFARSLVTRRSNHVGVITLGAEYYGPSQTVTHLGAELRESGYEVVLSSLAGTNADDLHDLVRQAVDNAVDGLVLVTPLAEVSAERVAAVCDGVPFVMVDVDAGRRVHSVVIDQKHGARLATRHLVERGHERIAEISGPLDWSDAKGRHEGHVQILSEHRLRSAGFYEGNWEAESGYRGVTRLLDGGATFTGLVAGNDQMALGAIKALSDRGLRVPEDVSVVGFDDTAEAPYFLPPLTTVRQDFAALGRQCADLVSGLIADRDLPVQQRVLYPSLIVRSSTTAR